MPPSSNQNLHLDAQEGSRERDNTRKVGQDANKNMQILSEYSAGEQSDPTSLQLRLTGSSVKISPSHNRRETGRLYFQRSPTTKTGKQRRVLERYELAIPGQAFTVTIELTRSRFGNR